MKKFLISLGLVCALIFGAFADEVADAEVEAQNEAIAAEQEAAQNGEAAEEAAAEETTEGETVAEETPAEEAAEEAVPTENTEEPAVAEGDNGEAEAEPAAEETETVAETEEPAGEDIAAAEETPAEEPVAEESPAEEVAENTETEEDQTETAEASLPSMSDIADAAEDIADAAIDAAAGVAEEELKALIASFPKGTWIDSKYNAAWVFDENGMLTVQNAKTGKVYFTFSLNKINSYSVMPTADGIAVSFVCGETKRQYTFIKSNDDDYNMTLKIQAKWLKNGYTTQMSKKQNIRVGKN